MRSVGSEKLKERERFLSALGTAVRSRRTECGLTLKAVAQRASVSERFLVQLELGSGNISVARLRDVADALFTTPSELLLAGERASSVDSPLASGPVALIGLRGAGKTTVGRILSKRLARPFVELDALVAEEAGMPLKTIFELHGEGYFRRLEREVLGRLFDSGSGAVIATGGAIVTAPETFNVLRSRATTVWLRARAVDHWNRVISQGDLRPMENRANAMSELETLLRSRRSLYELAEHVIETTGKTAAHVADEVVNALSRDPRGGRHEASETRGAALGHPLTIGKGSRKPTRALKTPTATRTAQTAGGTKLMKETAS